MSWLQEKKIHQIIPKYRIYRNVYRLIIFFHTLSGKKLPPALHAGYLTVKLDRCERPNYFNDSWARELPEIARNENKTKKKKLIIINAINNISKSKNFEKDRQRTNCHGNGPSSD